MRSALQSLSCFYSKKKSLLEGFRSFLLLYVNSINAVYLACCTDIESVMVLCAILTMIQHLLKSRQNYFTFERAFNVCHRTLSKHQTINLIILTCLEL